MTNVLPAGELTLNSLVSEAFVQFFVEIVGHYSLHMSVTEQGQRVFQREPFRKSHGSRTVRHFLHCFMETQMFAGFIQDRELSKSLAKGLASPSLFLGLASPSCCLVWHRLLVPSLLHRLPVEVRRHVRLLLGFCPME